ncbi:hypothetical protein ACWKT3_04655 [Streptomyces violaceus]
MPPSRFFGELRDAAADARLPLRTFTDEASDVDGERHLTLAAGGRTTMQGWWGKQPTARASVPVMDRLVVQHRRGAGSF